MQIMKESLSILESTIQTLTKNLQAYSQRAEANQSFIDFQNRIISGLVQVFNQVQKLELDPVAIAVSKEISKLDSLGIDMDGFNIRVTRNPKGNRYPLIFVNDF